MIAADIFGHDRCIMNSLVALFGRRLCEITLDVYGESFIADIEVKYCYVSTSYAEEFASEGLLAITPTVTV